MRLILLLLLFLRFIRTLVVLLRDRFMGTINCCRCVQRECLGWIFGLVFVADTFSSFIDEGHFSTADDILMLRLDLHVTQLRVMPSSSWELIFSMIDLSCLNWYLSLFIVGSLASFVLRRFSHVALIISCCEIL